MIRRRIIRYEFVMNEAEFSVFKIMCEKYAYEYIVGNDKEYYVVMNEEELYAVERALEIYIGEFEFDYECEVREISTEEWEFYDSVKELLNNITDEENEEEW